MKKNNKILILGLSILAFSPIVALAALIPCDGVTVKCDFAAASKLVNTVINWFLTMSGVIATITISIAGGKILLNPSDPKKLEEGRSMLFKSIIGMVIVLVAWLAIHTVVGALVNPNSGALMFFGK